jgi:hypothetical protein
MAGQKIYPDSKLLTIFVILLAAPTAVEGDSSTPVMLAGTQGEAVAEMAATSAAAAISILPAAAASPASTAE